MTERGHGHPPGRALGHLEDLSLLLRPWPWWLYGDLVAWAGGMIHCLICFGVFASSPVEDE